MSEDSNFKANQEGENPKGIRKRPFLCETQKAYFAAFLDCDGSLIGTIVPTSESLLGYKLSFTFQLTQLKKRKPYLEKIKEELQMGQIRERGTICDYYTSNREDLLWLLIQIQPYVRMKKGQLNKMIDCLKQMPRSRKEKIVPDKFLKLCHDVDAISSLNDSKETRLHTAASVLLFFQKNDIPAPN